MNRKICFDLESWTLELGSGMQINLKSVDKRVEGVKNYLAYHKIIICAENDGLVFDISTSQTVN
jgi:hypothetical protein